MNQDRYQTYPTTQWTGDGQQYPASPSYSTTGYQPASHEPAIARQVQPTFGGVDPHSGNGPYHEGYYSTSPAYVHSASAAVGQQPMHAATQGISMLRRPQSPHGHSHSHSHSHVHSPYEQVSSQSQSYYPQSRPRSHSQTPSYIRSQIAPITIPQHSPSHFHSPPQAISISPQYPATPIRPFSCDLCALSFNRQHDLKRHRETHTGEKPYLCNGGCGKTFTRKDALKRHQLVKGCGKVDEAWP
ncbi:Transcriptional regulator CRZ1 [Hypsizygus marmoreus]|uniref:Transcriptional regulator CRZ1 n=1 Tax=Hypsizygus marmoreus TaxID=39966 RepID=A0A369JZ94_HYPMA|nr:Transcriptional regulator CRZ1 [Hypsizygus marmoreus]